MVVKVAMADHFQFKVMPSIKNFCLLKQGDVHYIGGTDILPAPLGASEEQSAIEALGTASDAEAKHTLSPVMPSANQVSRSSCRFTSIWAKRL